MKLTRSGRTVTMPAKFAASVMQVENGAHNTYIMRLPEKGEEQVVREETIGVFEDSPEDINEPISHEENLEVGKGFIRTMVYRGEPTEATHNSTEEGSGLTEFSLTNIPIEVIEEPADTKEIPTGDTTSSEDVFGHEGETLGLAEQFRLIQSQSKLRSVEEEEISDHVISIEEDGQITIEQVRQCDSPPSEPSTSLPAFPEWWLRLSATFLSFLSTGHLVDLWLVCCDGEAVPAHQLLLSHASSTLASWLAEARQDTQEEAVTLSLPDWDSDTVGHFISALYQGHLPSGFGDRTRVYQLCRELGVELGDMEAVVKDSTGSGERKDYSVKEEVKETGESSLPLATSLGSQQVQVVQTDSGEILLVTCEAGQQDRLQLHPTQSGLQLQPPTQAENVARAAQYDDEVERVKAVKIAQIKEQQSKQCPVCFNTAIQHRFSCTGQDQKFVYRCCSQDCNTDNLKTARAFNQHMVKHGDSVQYEPASRVCPLCFRPRIEHKNRSLSDEEKGNHRGNLYKCCHCAAAKLSAKKFFVHLENHVTKKHVCSTCGKGYSYKHLLNEHTWKDHGEGRHVRYPCNWENCDYTARYKQTLHTHVMERHHGVKRKHRQEDAYKMVECPNCKKTLKKWYFQQFHKKTCSSGNVIYQCEICGKEGFINAVTLQNHVRTKHSADRPFTCEYCPAKYATAMSLSGHRSRKHGVNSRGDLVPKKMFSCDHCGKLLTSKMKLQAHIEVIHEGRRDYKCRFCDKTFTSKSNLQIHEGSLHTGVLPYRCDFCQKMFARRTQLTSHKETQHPGHAGPFFVVEDVDTVQVEDIVIPVEEVEDGTVEISVEGIMEDVHSA